MNFFVQIEEEKKNQRKILNINYENAYYTSVKPFIHIIPRDIVET